MEIGASVNLHLRLLPLLLALCIVAGCSARVRPIVQEEDPFLMSVADVSRAMDRATSALHPSCDRTGNVGACLNASKDFTDIAIVSARRLESFANDPDWSEDSRALARSLKRLAKAMQDRTKSLERRDTQSWRSAQGDLDAASSEYADALAALGTPTSS
jgi:hypothetical protein